MDSKNNAVRYIVSATPSARARASTSFVGMVSSTARVRLSGVRVPLTRYTFFDDGRRNRPISRGVLGDDRASSSTVSAAGVGRAAEGGLGGRRVGVDGVGGSSARSCRRSVHAPARSPRRRAGYVASAPARSGCKSVAPLVAGLVSSNGRFCSGCRSRM